MEILVLGTGLQGKAALFDLVRSTHIHHIIAADLDINSLENFIQKIGSNKVETIFLDVENTEKVKLLMRSVKAVLVLLPTQYRLPMVRLAIECGIHIIDASYPLPEYMELEEQAKAHGVAILPECGLDPGIDLILAGQAFKEFEQVDTYLTYGAGIPDPAADDNLLRYKISWTFSGVLSAYQRPARIVQNGQIVDIPPSDIFSDKYFHPVEVRGLGTLEAYPNGDAVQYIEQLGVKGMVKTAGRYSLRWPGHVAFWRKMSGLGFLNQTPVKIGDQEVVPRKFVHDLLEPKLHYRPDERDIALVRVEVSGIRDGNPQRRVYQVIDYRDLESGLYAMQRTVGFTASICAQMLLRGDIPGRGLLSPISDVPANIFFSELKKRNIEVEIFQI